jgi:N-acetylmuramoyl-L-alanine amidase
VFTVFVLVFIFCTTFSFAQQGGKGIVNATNLNIRENPSTSATVIGQIPDKNKIDIIEESNGWYKVAYNGKTGWVYASYVKIVEEPKQEVQNTPDKTVTSQEGASKIGIINASSLNMRESANTSSRVIEQIPEGGKVSIIIESGNWYKAQYNGKNGWLYASYVSIRENAPDAKAPEVWSTPIPTSAPTPVPTPVPVIQPTSVPEVRTPEQKEPSDGTNTIVDKTLIEDKTLTANESSPKSDSSSGTIEGKALTENIQPSAQLINEGKITASELNVRNGAGTGYRVVGTLSYGDSIEIKGRNGEWFQISTSGGTKGWVHSRYVLQSDAIASRGEKVVDRTLITPEDMVDNSILDTRLAIVEYAKKFLGVPYVYGGSSPNGFDCSGFVMYVFKHSGISLNRVAADQATQGSKIAKSELKPGDLVFFDTNGGHNYINHVGIYVGDGMFIHSSSGNSNRKVVISNLVSGFYNESYMTARRFLD